MQLERPLRSASEGQDSISAPPLNVELTTPMHHRIQRALTLYERSGAPYSNQSDRNPFPIPS